MKASVSGNPILSDNIVFPAGARRLVIKIGSAQITSGGKINSSKIRKIVSECISLIKQKKQIILVSSGAIASARFLFPAGYKLSLIEKQALASIGQVFLMEYYKKAFGSAKIPA
ncbi:MAG TPA: hypothetical protein DC049_18630, partial [Spirochaetia bacterium]|nr:hypothetical protein [Spirochaetia bacterium]